MSWLRDICHQIFSRHSNFKSSCCGTNSSGNASLDNYSRFPESCMVPLCAMMAQKMLNFLDLHTHRRFTDQIKHKWFYFGLNQVLFNKKQLSQADPQQLQPGCSSAPGVNANCKLKLSFPHSDSILMLPNSKNIHEPQRATQEYCPCCGKDLEFLPKNQRVNEVHEREKCWNESLGTTALFINRKSSL